MSDFDAARTDVALGALIADARRQAAHARRLSGPPIDAIAGYSLIREIHRGGQGVVYLAHQQATRRDVAVKLLRDGLLWGRASARVSSAKCRFSLH